VAAQENWQLVESQHTISVPIVPIRVITFTVKPEMLPFLLFFVLAIVVIVAAIHSHRAAQHRVAQLAALAARLRWNFNPAEFSDYTLDSFAAFTRGHSQSAYNTLRGVIEIDDAEWTAQAGDFEYKTTSHNGKRTTTHTHYLSYLVIDTPHLGAPDLAIRREGFLDRFAGFMGFDDIDFESAEFSERFHVKSSNRRFAYAVLDPRMMEFLLESAPPTIEMHAGRCCLLRGESQWTPDEFGATIAWARDFFARWPRQIPSVLDT
jgi:hypothetical protein